MQLHQRQLQRRTHGTRAILNFTKASYSKARTHERKAKTMYMRAPLLETREGMERACSKAILAGSVESLIRIPVAVVSFNYLQAHSYTHTYIHSP